MGLSRQSVHAIVQRLVVDGLVQIVPNADHRRSPLVDLTEAGRSKYEAIDRRQAAWVDALARGLDHSDLATAARVLDELCRRLEDDRAEEGGVTTSAKVNR
jgi:DNA-binding MarR family transcriptional regulator